MANNLNPNIFLSYCWANTDIADEVDNTFKSIDIQFKRDVRDATYRKSIKEFMQQIGQSDFVLMIISNEYLLSENCMYEVTELLSTHEFESRILPVVIDNAIHIFKAEKQVIYYDHWQKELKAAKDLKRKHPNSVYIDLVKKRQNINDHMDVFFQKVTDLNVSSYKKLREENYRELLKIIGFDDQLLLEEVIAISKIEDLELQEIELDRFLERHPKNKYGLLQKSLLAKVQKHHQKERSFLERAIESDNSFSTAHNNLAILLESNFSDYNGAKKHYEAAIKIDPKDSRAHFNLAQLLEDHFWDYKSAKEHYEMAIESDPNCNFLMHYNLAVLLDKHFLDYEAARNRFEKAIESEPNDAITHYNLALLLEKIFLDFKGAKEHYEFAIKADSNFALAHNNLGILLTENFFEYNIAKKHYEMAIAANPNHVKAYNNLALLLENKFFNYVEAKTNYEMALKIDPKYIVAKMNLARLIQNYFKK